MKTIAPSRCPICSDQHIESLFEYIKNRPFSSLGTHTIPTAETHDETPCNGCRKTGEIFCKECNGNGQIVCSHCNGSGSQRIRRDCENCGGEEPYLRECSYCNETGEVWDTEPCPECQGQRKMTCSLCIGDGKVACNSCDGSGFRHRYEVTEFSFNRDTEANTLPDSWTDNHRSFGGKLPWEADQLLFDTASSDDIYIKTDTLDAVYVTVEYGENSYYAAIVEWSEDKKVIWDPEIEFPQNEAAEIGRSLKRTIESVAGVVASVGIAPDMTTAKLASEAEKPDGLVVIKPDDVRSFLAPIPVEELYGVGPVTSSELRSMGFETAGDIAATEASVFVDAFGERGRDLYAQACGEDDRMVEPRGDPKSISSESAFVEATEASNKKERKIRKLAEAAEQDVRERSTY